MTQRPVVLVADDQITNLALLADILAAKYRVLTATSGQLALQLASGQPTPDLILLDVEMPDKTGYDVLAELKGSAVTYDIPVIIVTARDGDQDEEHGLRLGACDYISKPVRPGILLARIATQLENKQARDLLRDQNKWLLSEVERRIHDRQLVQDASLFALAVLAESRDHITGNHINRTQAYVSLLVEDLARQARDSRDLAGDLAKHIVQASPLHDIGKVGIPDAILLKPGKLTPDEFEIMKTHSTIGATTIEMAMKRVLAADDSPLAGDGSALNFLLVARQIAGSHHERWDGGGYPDQLKGEEIPLAARVMAIADVYDALTTTRHYKTPMPHDQAVAYVVERRGTQFDPVIVDTFERLHLQFLEIAQRLSD